MSESNNIPTGGLTTKEILLQLMTSIGAIEKKVDESRESQIRTETILSEGRYGERLTALETWKNQAVGWVSAGKWSLGGSGIALLGSLVSMYLALTKGN